ncbi:putative cold-regulated 413 protein [Medicago truncatula]|uniref:Cold-regulated 413 plasma membrane-like protein n=1 Tax=Medicago truncatula TaxID=3880 RepID=G7ZVI3_MEDTR|nr:cold-regulated 413 plasma membrane protein 2 [Medicago truncatula]KEH20463.1 cold-regulated 413 plasma membrane-like protein [Medicago truncatula]RHN42173.1 putative cold-regulated 413 protein [Medicago truncatula]
MGRMLMNYLAMKTDPVVASLIDSDLNELKFAAKKLFNDAAMLGGKGVGMSLLRWIASFAAIYLLILDRTNWRTNMLTSLLVPYIFFSFPESLYNFFRGGVGKWFAFVAVVLRLFFNKHFPDWLELPGSIVLLLTVTPDLFAIKFRNNWIGVAIDLFIGCYLLQEHIRATGGFRNSFTQRHGISNTLGIIFLIVYPIWAMVIR